MKKREENLHNDLKIRCAEKNEVGFMVNFELSVEVVLGFVLEIDFMEAFAMIISSFEGYTGF